MSQADQKTVIAPIVHLNGTSRDELLHNIEAVYDALETAILTLRRAAPNARDYYPQIGLMPEAEKQHRRRMQSLSDLQREVEIEIGMIADQ